jgi:FAD/FMN-containing dehydrogenase
LFWALRGAVPGRRELSFTAIGGAYNRGPADATAFVHRRPVPAGSRRSRRDQWLDRSWTRAHAHASGRVYPDFPDPDLDDWTAAYHGGNAERLRAVKRRFDPERLFRFPQAI